MAWYRELAGCSAFVGGVEAIRLISDSRSFYDAIKTFDFEWGVLNQLEVLATIVTCFAILQAVKRLLDPKLLVSTLILFSAGGLVNLVPWVFAAGGDYVRWPAAGILAVLALFLTVMALGFDREEVELTLFQWRDEQDRLKTAAVNEANRALRLRIKAQQSRRSSHLELKALVLTA